MLFDSSLSYKPFAYPWAEEMYQTQTIELFWNPNTIKFQDDLSDYMKLEEPDKEFIRMILTFFTQADIDVAKNYIDFYLRWFKRIELRKMLLANAHTESLHITAYSKLTASLGLEDYEEFYQYPEMSAKHDWMSAPINTGKVHEDALKALVVSSVFGEGLQLFGTFAMLLGYCAGGKFQGMRDVVQWSLRDETHHVKCAVLLIDEIRKEFYSGKFPEHIKSMIYGVAMEATDLEDKYISLVYTEGLNIPNVSLGDIKKYIQFLCNFRLRQIGLKSLYQTEVNPLKSLMGMYSNELHESFFEGTKTSYQHSRFDTSLMW